MTHPTTPLDYETPGRRSLEPGSEPAPARRHGWIGWKTLVGGYVVVGAVLVVMVIILPPMQYLWRDFNAPLPALTQAMVDFSQWVRGDLGWLSLLILPMGLSLVTGVIGFVFRRGRQAPPSASSRWVGWRGMVLIVGLLLMGLAALTIIAIFLPIVSLIESVSQP